MNQKLIKGGHTSYLQHHTSNRGITLIALVITIIVLLILAGVTISMVLGDDGIIAQAQGAKKANEDSSLKDAVEVAKGEAALLVYNKQTPMSDSDLNKALGKTGDDAIENNKTVAKVVDGVPIPVGFAYVEGTKKDTGLIVVDGYGNEYVWVPVSDTTSWTKPGIEPSDEQGTTDSINDDFELMKTSVNIYKGFYVGRYETSWTGSRVASVPNVSSMSGTTTVDETGANWYTFYTKQKELYNKNSDSVVSGMIYDGQWDAIMDWMSDVENPNAVDPNYNLYIQDSTGMGHFCFDANFELITDELAPIKTGSNSVYSVKNIYDLAGNYYEWTQRSNGGSARMVRGGYYDDPGFLHPASTRDWDYRDDEDNYNSSRLQLYIK